MTRDETAPEPDGAPDSVVSPEIEAGSPAERAQAVRCGSRWIAFPYGWARGAVERVPLSKVPGAPAWLAGAANVEGRIVPVIDLLAWSLPGQAVDSESKGARLLVGGDGEDTVAVLFEGLPRAVHVVRQAALRADGDRLAAYAFGYELDDANTLALDAPRWVEALIEELAPR